MMPLPQHDSARGAGRAFALIVALKTLIVIFFAAIVTAQFWLLPMLAGQMAVLDPAHAWLRIPYLVVAIAILACFAVGLVALWRLLSMTGRGRVFSRSAFVWVDVIVWCALAAAALTAALFAHALSVSAGPPPLAMMIFVGLLAEVGFVLLVLVMRSLLVSATEQHDELQSVI